MTVAPFVPVREGAPMKGEALPLGEGRLTVKSVHAGRVWATCRGDGETYDLGYAHGRWHCSCPARTIDCAHLIALRLVCERPTR
jgi:hypothetical protein